MSVLVFCATKKWCKTTANLLANEILSERSRAEAVAKANSSSVRSKNGVLPIIRPGHGEASDTPRRSSRETVKSQRSGGKDGAGFVSAKSVVGRGVRDSALHLVRDGSTSRSRGDFGGNGPTIIAEELDAARVRERLRQTPVGLDADLAHLVRTLSYITLHYTFDRVSLVYD